MPWPQIGATYYHVQLGLPDKGSTIKGLIVCYVVWLEIYDLWDGSVGVVRMIYTFTLRGQIIYLK